MRWQTPTRLTPDSTLVGIDFETTGLDPRNDHVVEVAAVTAQNGRITQAWSHIIIDAPEPPDHVIWINAITQELMNETGIPGDTVFTRLAETTRNTVTIAHRLPFEVDFWAHECARRNLPIPRREAWCSKLLGWAGHQHHVAGLPSTVGIYGINTNSVMRELADTYTGECTLNECLTPHRALLDAALSVKLAHRVLTHPTKNPGRVDTRSDGVAISQAWCARMPSLQPLSRDPQQVEAYENALSVYPMHVAI